MNNIFTLTAHREDLQHVFDYEIYTILFQIKENVVENIGVQVCVRHRYEYFKIIKWSVSTFIYIFSI